MQDYVIHILTDYGYIGIFLFILLENVFPPIPSEVILTFGGFFSEHSSLEFHWLVIFSTAGSVFGALILYGVGRCVPLGRIDRFLGNRWIRRLGFKPGDIEKTLKWFDKYESPAVLIGRCVPIIRSLISIPAGMAKMPLMKFIIYTFIGSSIWNFLLLYLGRTAGASWESILSVFDKYSYGIIVLIAAAAVIFVICKFIKQRKK